MSKLYIKEVKRCIECPAFDVTMTGFYCKVLGNFFKNKPEPKDPYTQVQEWCPLEDVKK